MVVSVWFWVVFNAAILLLLFLDLAVWGRSGRAMSFRQAALSSAVWIALAGGFAFMVHEWMGPTKTLEFTTGYLIEEALSVDNLFVFILIFSYFKVPPEQERKVLFWGIIGALMMRGAFIAAGVTLVKRFHVLLYAFGIFLVWSGFKLMSEKDHQAVDPSKNVVLKVFRKFLPVSEAFENGRFLVRRDGRLYATPLLVVLLVVETTDILFATDSIPAILAISRDPFIVYTSNVFAILGLRSLYFALSGLMKLFRYLNYGLAGVLVFIGVKMLVAYWLEIPTWVALLVIAVLLGISVAASLWSAPKAPEADRELRQ